MLGYQKQAHMRVRVRILWMFEEDRAHMEVQIERKVWEARLLKLAQTTLLANSTVWI
jgi:hypothetical protein